MGVNRKKGRSSAGTGRVRIDGRPKELVQLARAGKLDLSDWDIEELLRGYRRAKDGSFRGRPPLVVPREVHDELAKRVKHEVAHELRGIAAEHIKPVYERIVSAGVSGWDAEEIQMMKLQLTAAQDLMDRFVVGKSEKIEIAGTMRHEATIDSVTVDRDLPDDDIVDAEVVEEED